MEQTRSTPDSTARRPAAEHGTSAGTAPLPAPGQGPRGAEETELGPFGLPPSKPLERYEIESIYGNESLEALLAEAEAVIALAPPEPPPERPDPVPPPPPRGRGTDTGPTDRITVRETARHYVVRHRGEALFRGADQTRARSVLIEALRRHGGGEVTLGCITTREHTTRSTEYVELPCRVEIVLQSSR